MIDDQVVGIEVLELGVALSIPQEVENDLRRLHRPTALAIAGALGALVKENAQERAWWCCR